MKQVYKYDNNGKYIEPVLLNDNDPIPKNCTEKPLPQPNWKPVFQNGDWVEIATEEEKNPTSAPAMTTEYRLELMQQALDDLIMGGGL